jgi:hypothetical protein
MFSIPSIGEYQQLSVNTHAQQHKACKQVRGGADACTLITEPGYSWLMADHVQHSTTGKYQQLSADNDSALGCAT